jgi:hypothetical protein
MQTANTIERAMIFNKMNHYTAPGYTKAMHIEQSESLDAIITTINEREKQRGGGWSHARSAINAYDVNVRNGTLLDKFAIY